MGWVRIVYRFLLLLLSILVLPAPARSAGGQYLTICHGYSCYYETRLPFGADSLGRVASIMRAGAGSPEAERRALSRAIQYFEQRTTALLGIRDRPKGELGHGRELGQMDCIDESTNTTTILRFIADKGLMRHHKVLRTASRGYLLDNRFPHFTAVLRDGAGRKWAVDSWYEPGGGAPDIMPFDDWRVRGVAGQR